MKVGFIGAGMMATAMCRGFIASSLVKPADVLVSDVNRAKLRSIRELGVNTTTSNRDVIMQNEIVYLSVKPYVIPEIIKEIAPFVLPKKNLIVSVAAGITIDSIQKVLPAGSRVIRVMPNTPAVVQSAACVFSCGQCVAPEDADRVTEMLSCIGLVEEMPENLMDAVTGLSGNGPAYGFVMIQALADGGVKMGLNRDQSTRLAAQSLLGAARVILETKKHPEQLKDEVCSPGGTSAHAIHAMEKGGFRGTLIDAVQAGTLRSKEIGNKYKVSNGAGKQQDKADEPIEMYAY